MGAMCVCLYLHMRVLDKVTHCPSEYGKYGKNNCAARIQQSLFSPNKNSILSVPDVLLNWGKFSLNLG